MPKKYQNTLAFAKEMDKKDSLKKFRRLFHIPKQKNGKPHLYFCGNSLGLQPKSTQKAIEQELEDWKKYGVEGHFEGKTPWLPYHEFLTKNMAAVVGAKPIETVVMNTLSVNLHLMMVSFYRPTKKRYKILIEHDAFPSDRYAVASQAKFHGFDPDKAIIDLKAREGETLLRMEDIEELIEKEGDKIALILFGNPNYYTGQFLDMKTITKLGHKKGCKVGFDCAHGAGNIPLKLHDSGADFAVWCTYKYLNSGPGSLGGCFVHERHAKDVELPKFTGWWGHNKKTRFKMRDAFEPIAGVESWQLSNPPILSMAAINASLKVFKEAGMNNLRKKSILMTGFLEFLLNDVESDRFTVITPSDPSQRGCQLSIQIKNANKKTYDKLTKKGVIADWREPDVIRVAPVPLYNTFEDCWRLTTALKEVVG